jgi:hypothetical protein
MATSQNGYRANDRTLVSSRLVPGTTRKLTVRNGPAGDLLLWVASQFDARVEDIEQGVLDDWGYAERTIRGDSTTLSNHASGTAIDLNATAHPLGTAPSANYSASEVAQIRAVVARAEGCVRWGGDYTGRKDGMHFEIVASEQRCAAVMAKLTAVGGAAAAASTGGAAAPTTGVDLMERINVTPPNGGSNPVRLFLPGGPNCKVIVRPQLNGDGKVKAPMWVGDIFAWGQDGAGVGHNPTQVKGYNNRLENHREYPLPDALWCDLNYSSSLPFTIDIVG